MTVDGSARRVPLSTTNEAPRGANSSRMRAGSSSQQEEGSPPCAEAGRRTLVHSSGRSSIASRAWHVSSAGMRMPMVRRCLHTCSPRLSRMQDLGSALLAGRMRVYCARSRGGASASAPAARGGAEPARGAGSAPRQAASRERCGKHRLGSRWCTCPRQKTSGRAATAASSSGRPRSSPCTVPPRRPCSPHRRRWRRWCRWG